MTNFAFKCQSIEQLQVNKIPHLFAEAGRTLKESLEDFWEESWLLERVESLRSRMRERVKDKILWSPFNNNQAAIMCKFWTTCKESVNNI